MSGTSRRLVDSSTNDMWHSNIYEMEKRMRDMEREMTVMFNKMRHLVPAPQSDIPPLSMLDSGFPDTPISNPVVMDEEGNRNLRYNIDLHYYSPSEINISTFDDRKIEVRAKHENSEDGHRVYREYHRIITVPQGVNLDTVRSDLHPGGILSIEAALPPNAKIGSAKAVQARNEPIAMPIQHLTKNKQ